MVLALILLILVFGGLGFTAHVLWWAALIAVIVLLVNARPPYRH